MKLKVGSWMLPLPTFLRFELPTSIWADSDRLRIVLLGLVSPWVQFAIFRELLGAYGGNEYLIGISLGFWLLFGGLGGALARWRRTEDAPFHGLDRWLWSSLAFLPLLALILLRGARYRIFPVGVGLSLSQQIVVALCIHFVFCVPGGYLLVRLCQRLAGRVGAYGIGESYYLDALGSIVGGLLFVYPLSYYLGHIQIAAVGGTLLILPEIVGHGRSTQGGWRSQMGPILLAALLVSTGLIGEKPTLAWLLPAGELTYEARSPYGQILVAQLEDQRIYLRNGAMLFSTNVPEAVEQFIHLPLLVHPNPERVLVMAPPMAEIAQAVLQHPVRELFFVQPDKALNNALAACGDSSNDKRCRTIVADPRNYLTRTPGSFDVLIQTEPLPTTLLANRYFTREFAAMARRSLRKGGVFSFSLGEFANYFDATRAALIASIVRPVQEEFRFVKILPGDRLILVASDVPLDLNFRSSLETRRLQTLFVRPGYLGTTVEAPDRQQTVARVLSARASANSDGFPVASRLVLEKWLEEYGHPLGLAECILAAGVVLFLLRMKGCYWPVFATGFSSSGLEYVGLAAVQSVVGTIYYLAPLLVTSFMAGLLVGVIWAKRKAKGTTIARLLFVYCVFGVLVSLWTALTTGSAGLRLSWLAATSPGYAVLTAIWAATLAVLGGLTSTVFTLAGLEESEVLSSRASRVYAADFVGGAVGAVVFAVLLVPVLGMAIAALTPTALLAGILIVRKFASKPAAQVNRF